MICPNADRREIADLIHRLADLLGINDPPLFESAVGLPPDTELVASALNAVAPGWRRRALLVPPDHPFAW